MSMQFRYIHFTDDDNGNSSYVISNSAYIIIVVKLHVKL